MPRTNRDGGAVVIPISRHPRSREARRRELWLAALAAGALVVIVLLVARPFDVRAAPPEDASPALFAD